MSTPLPTPRLPAAPPSPPHARRNLLNTATTASAYLCAASLLCWAFFLAFAAPGMVTSLQRHTALALHRHTVTLYRVSPVPPAVARQSYPNERGPFYRVDVRLRLPYGLVAALAAVPPAA